MVFSSIQHAGYLVPDLETAVAWYVNAFGCTYTGGGPATGVAGRIGFVQMGAAEVELIEPADKSAFARSTDHIFHHIGYVVEDLDEAITEFRRKGYRFATPQPMVNAAGYRLIFFDTSYTHGTRVHLTDVRSIGRDHA